MVEATVAWRGELGLLLIVELIKHRNDLRVLENVRWVAAAMK